MLKPYKVQAYSDLMNVEMNCVTKEQAFEMFQMFKDSPLYHSGDLSDNYTGELYAYFYKEDDANGIKTTDWIAVE